MGLPAADKPVIGVVGGVGAGKSTAAAELARLGCALIDADRIGHELLAEQSVRRELRERWGGRIFNEQGHVDRKALGEIVFSDPDELAALNAVVHPRIRRRMAEQIADFRARSDVPAVVVDAAVLFEAGWNDLCTHLVFVDCPPDERLRRVRAGRQWDEKTWRQREKSQNFLDTKRQMCEDTIDGSSDVSHLVEQLRELFHRIVIASDRF